MAFHIEIEADFELKVKLWKEVELDNGEKRLDRTRETFKFETQTEEEEIASQAFFQRVEDWLAKKKRELGVSPDNVPEQTASSL